MTYLRRECASETQFEQMVCQWAKALTEEDTAWHFMEEKFL